MRKYKMSIPEDKDNKGVFAISLVEKPAMESEWVALKQEEVKLKGIDDKEQMLLGVALIPDKPVYRNDDNGEYLIEFSKDAIKETAYKFIKSGNGNNATVNHDIKLGKDTVNVVESWIIEHDEKDKTRLHGISEPVGSWVVKMKVNDPELYNKASRGELKGISIEGLFDKELVNLKSESYMSKSIESAISDGFAEVFKMFKNEQPKQPEKVELGEVTLQDGETVVSYEGEELTGGVTATVGGEPIPEGEHQTESGQVIVVKEAGTISEVKEASEGGDEEVDAEREQIKKAISDAVMELKKTFDAKLEENSKGYQEKITKLESQVEKLSNQENESKKNQNFKPNVDLTREGRILQSIRN